MNTKRFCFGLILGIWMGGATAFAAEAPLPPRQPVQDIGARLVLARGGALAVPFRIGTVRLRLPGGSLDLPLTEIQSVRYPAATTTAAAADSDECRIVTVHGDVLVGRCPFAEFRRLLKTPDILDDKEGDAAAIAFATPEADATVADTLHSVPWVVRLSNGTVLHADLRDDVLSLESDAGSFRLPTPLVAAIERDAGTDLLVIRLADAPYAVRSYLPRAELRIADTAGRGLSVPWADVVSISATEHSGANETLRFTQDAEISTTNAPSRTMPFPVYGLTLRGEAGDILLPGTRLLRIVRNADRTHTVFTVAGDILTGRLSFPKQPEPDASVLSAAPVRETPIAFADADRIEFRDHAAPALSDTAAAWRLATGDILVGDWERGDGDGATAATAAPTAAPVAAAAASRIAAVASPSAVAAPSTIPQARTDGSWPDKRYTVRLAASGASLEIPAKTLEAVRPGPATDLPPARIPAGPSAMASDEVRFDGGVFRLGRASGEGPSDEVPAVNVQVPPFYLANTPVTVAQFRAFVDDTGYKTVAETAPGEKTWLLPGFTQTDDDPVVCLSWIDAATYCNWRSKRAGLVPAYTIRDGGRRIVLDLDADGYRLPLEAEWEYAARNGGQDIPFPWGAAATEAEAQEFANFRPEELFLDPWPATNPVKAFPAQPSGLYGMAGNVWEWCQDLYVPNAYATAYRSGTIETLLNPEPGAPASARVMRGGSYFNRLPFLRCTARGFGHEQVGAPRVGMRVARNAD